jgi:alpha-D-ribose 1-methylphosphonate 5-triphosphate diphosphatase
MDLVRNRAIDLVSLMDHTPGFGVFKDIEAYRRYHIRSGVSLDATDDMINVRLRLRRTVDESKIAQLIALCHEHDVAVASHDDHTRKKIEWARTHNICIAEFPVTMEAVSSARELGLWTVFGAANFVRGKSHAENLNAKEMVMEGLADILSSDYSPMSLIHALFKSRDQTRRPLSEIVNMFTLNPAKAVGINNTGAIVAGYIADLILVDVNEGQPRIVTTIVGGNPVYTCENPHQRW